jgi:hypothetical protein
LKVLTEWNRRRHEAELDTIYHASWIPQGQPLRVRGCHLCGATLVLSASEDEPYRCCNCRAAHVALTIARRPSEPHIERPKYGRLTVLRAISTSEMLCICDCDGKSIKRRKYDLERGMARSCGCLRLEALRRAHDKRKAAKAAA